MVASTRSTMVKCGIGFCFVMLMWVSYLVVHDPIRPQTQSQNVEEKKSIRAYPEYNWRSPMELAARYFEGCKHIINKTRGPLFLDPERGKYSYRPMTEHNMIMELIKCGVPFSFTRYGDGEYLLAAGLSIGNNTQARSVDHWSWRGGLGRLGSDLLLSLGHDYQHRIFILGLPKPFSTQTEMLRWYLNRTHQPTQYLSYSLLWGINWRQTINFMQDWILPRKLNQPVVCIINEDSWPRRHIILDWAFDIIYFPDDGPTWWETEGERASRYYQNIARAHNGTLFLVSVGPVSEAIIYYMSLANPLNQYVDIGSAVERWTKGVGTREYALDVVEWEDAQYGRDPITGELYTKVDSPIGEIVQ